MSVTDAAPPATDAAARMRANIMATAERLFRTLGYQKTTVADIARELRMSPANVYRFFPSKAAINEAICARLLAGLDESVWAVARSPDRAPDRLRAIFRLLQQQTLTLFFQERRMHDMIAAALEENWPIVAEHICTIEAAFRHVIADGQAAGDFSRTLDPDTTSRMLHATCAVFTHPVLVEACVSKNDDLAAIAACMAEFALRALRPD